MTYLTVECQVERISGCTVGQTKALVRPSKTKTIFGGFIIKIEKAIFRMSGPVSKSLSSILKEFPLKSNYSFSEENMLKETLLLDLKGLERNFVLMLHLTCDV